MKKVIVWTAIILLSALFIYASYQKLKIYPVFVSQLESSPMFGKYGKLLSILVPSIEILTVGLLLIRRTRLVGLYASFLLMLAFTVYVFVLPHFYKSPGCSCGGIINTSVGRGIFIST